MLSLLLALPASVVAQRVDQLRDGARVRISVGKRTSAVGVASSVTGDSATISFPGSTQSVRLGLRAANGLQVSTGVSRLKGAVVYGLAGLAIGGLGGAALGASAPVNCNQSFICGRAATASIVGVLGGLVGTVAGVAGGASKGLEGWETVREVR